MATSQANPWQHVTLKLFYGGTFKRNDLGSLSYMGRMSRTVGVEKDEFCWFTLLEEAEKCGKFRRNVDAIYYLNPNICFQRALDDKDAQLMCEIAERDRVVNAYFVVDVDLAKVAEFIEELRQPQVLHIPQKMLSSSDCLQVIDALKKKVQGRSIFNLVLDDIFPLCSSFNSLVWSYTSRVNNTVAHALAHVLFNSPGRVEWSDLLPLAVNNAVSFDLSLMK